MDPTANYYKTKRSFLIFVGALLLAIFAGFNITNGQEKISVLPFQLARPELLTHILLIAVLFSLFQFALQWAAQISEVQKNRFHRIDFVATTTVGIVSILCYVGWLVTPYVTAIHVKLEFEFAKSVLSVLAALAVAISGLSSLVAASASEKIASYFGRLIKRRGVAENEQLDNLLVSKHWLLNYNPARPKKEKEIAFNEDGSIGIGHNDNEHRWIVKNGLLEIFNSAGKVFSRFSYDPSTGVFLHTNDPDILSIRSQTIRPKSK